MGKANNGLLIFRDHVFIYNGIFNFLIFCYKVEDIVDTGSTLSCLISHLESKGASSVSVCAFLDKPARRKVHFQLVGEGKFYRGFEVNIIKQKKKITLVISW